MENKQFESFITEVDSGAFYEQISAFLSEVGKSICRYDKGGKLQFSFDIKPVRNTAQQGAGVKVVVESKAKYMRPPPTGAISEESATETPMWVNKDGSITLLAASHDDLFHGSISPINKKG